MCLQILPDCPSRMCLCSIWSARHVGVCIVWQSAHQQMCSLCAVWKEFTLFKGTGGWSVHVFCQCGLDLYSFSALGTGSSTENWSGEAGHGHKGLPFITAFRTLDNMAELSTTDLAYSRPTSSWFFLISTTERCLDRKQCHCLCLVCLWWQLYFFLLNRVWMIMGRIIQHHIQQGCKHGYQKYHHGANYCNINYVSAKVLTLTFTGSAYSPHKNKQTNKKREPTIKTGWIACWDLTWATVTRNC